MEGGRSVRATAAETSFVASFANVRNELIPV